MTASFTAGKIGLEPSVERAADAARSDAWFIHPLADMLLSCGGIVWILFGLHYFILGGSTVGPAANALFTISGLGALFLSETHTAATLVRAFGNADLRRTHKFHVFVLPVLLCLVAACGVAFPPILSVLAKLYFLLVPYHFVMQSYGIAKVYCLKQNYSLGRGEQRLMLSVCWLTIAANVLKQMTYKEWSGKEFLGQQIPFWGPLPAEICLSVEYLLVAAVSLFALAIIRKSIAQPQSATFPPAALFTLSTGLAAFTLGQDATGIFWLYVSAFFHGTQYLLAVLACHWKEVGLQRDKRLTSFLSNSPTTRFLGLCLLVSLSIYLAVPRIFESFGCNFVNTASAIFLAVNLHHFLIDGVMWKLRRKTIRSAFEPLKRSEASV